jgi:hypothetical protein
MNAIKTCLYAAISLLLIDALGLMAWIASGQTPADGFYLGAISANIIKLFLN